MQSHITPKDQPHPPVPETLTTAITSGHIEPPPVTYDTSQLFDIIDQPKPYEASIPSLNKLILTPTRGSPTPGLVTPGTDRDPINPTFPP